MNVNVQKQRLESDNLEQYSRTVRIHGVAGQDVLRLLRSLASSSSMGWENVDDALPGPMTTADELNSLCDRLGEEIFRKQVVES